MRSDEVGVGLGVVVSTEGFGEGDLGLMTSLVTWVKRFGLGVGVELDAGEGVEVVVISLVVVTDESLGTSVIEAEFFRTFVLYPMAVTKLSLVRNRVVGELIFLANLMVAMVPALVLPPASTGVPAVKMSSPLLTLTLPKRANIKSPKVTLGSPSASGSKERLI